MGVFHAQERFSSFEIAFAYEQASSARLALPRYCENAGLVSRNSMEIMKQCL